MNKKFAHPEWAQQLNDRLDNMFEVDFKMRRDPPDFVHPREVFFVGVEQLAPESAGLEMFVRYGRDPRVFVEGRDFWPVEMDEILSDMWIWAMEDGYNVVQQKRPRQRPDGAYVIEDRPPPYLMEKRPGPPRSGPDVPKDTYTTSYVNAFVVDEDVLASCLSREPVADRADQVGVWQKQTTTQERGGGEVLLEVVLTRRASDPRSVASVMGLWVAPRMRSPGQGRTGWGYGTQAVESALSEAARNGYGIIRMRCTTDYPAWFGFEPIVDEPDMWQLVMF